MATDVCSKLESPSESVWTQKPIPVPPVVFKTIRKILQWCNASILAPQCRIARPKCALNFGGRWFYKHNGIALTCREDEDEAVVIGLTAHEMCHWLCWVFYGDEPGEHNAAFYNFAEQVYSLCGVSVATAMKIEDSPPPSWENKTTWAEIRNSKRKQR